MGYILLIQPNTKMKLTDYIELTELWHEREYLQVGDTIRYEEWSPNRVAEFCAYFVKNIGVNQLNILHRFI